MDTCEHIYRTLEALVFYPKGAILSAVDDRWSGREVRDGQHLGAGGTCSWLCLSIAAMTSSGFHRTLGYLYTLLIC